MSEATLLLIRHAQTIDNVAERLAGWTDGDLTALGEQQVERLAERVNSTHRHASAIYASPLLRARRTAEAIGRLTGHEPIFDPDLREMHFGEFDGRSIDEVREGHPHLLLGDEDATNDEFGWPGGESRRGFVARTQAVIDRIALAHPRRLVAIVTHGGVISTFLALLHGQPAASWRQWLVPNASLSEIAWNPTTQRGRVLRHGDDAHLDELVSTRGAANG
jgi:broad specificity phosphatase PhoE